MPRRSWQVIMSLFERLKHIRLTGEQKARLQVCSGELTLLRASPRSETHLLVEYISGDGQRIAGQWLSEAERCETIACKTLVSAFHSSTPVPCLVWTEPGLPTTSVVLQAQGVDRKMPGLFPLVTSPDAELLVHHPERRAVVRLSSLEGPLYAKIVPPERLASLIATGQTARTLAATMFTTPRLVCLDRAAGISVWSALPGVPLNSLFASESLAESARKTGMALAALHKAQPVDLPHHSGVDEAALLHTWVTRTLAFFPGLGTRVADLLPEVQARLNGTATSDVTLHRDFYDKQVFVDDGIGMLDFDTLARGEAALDLGNMLAHFELRVLQGYCTGDQATIATAELLAGYQPDEATRVRLDSYINASRLRLACVYAFRPTWQHISAILLDRVKQDTVLNPTRELFVPDFQEG